MKKAKRHWRSFTKIEAGFDGLVNSLRFLTQCLRQHYGKKVILLMDEYDVPLQKSYDEGYYDQMLELIRPLFSKALKDNSNLEKAILTGCLRVSKESIFTGLNHLQVSTLLDAKSPSVFGFTQEEIDHLFAEFGYSDKLPFVKEWYDGYKFGGVEIYNPWSTLYYLLDLTYDPASLPKPYWGNTSGNEIIRSFVRHAAETMKKDFASLVNGNPIQKPIDPGVAFRDMQDSENIYSFLLMTGYLNSVSQDETGVHKLVIPNQEVRGLFEKDFQRYQKNLIGKVRGPLFAALAIQDVQTAQALLQSILKEVCSYYDNLEAWYHGFLGGLFKGEGFVVASNRESGNGRYELAVHTEDDQDFVLIACRHSKTKKLLEADAKAGLRKIQDRGYLSDPSLEDYANMNACSISFYKKNCCIKYYDPQEG